MPLNGRRCDALLTGRSPEGASAVIVELKQWSFVSHSHLSEHVFAGSRNVLHPSVQVRDYVETLKHYHSAFTGEGEPIALHGAAYLHDMPLKGDRAGLRDHELFGPLQKEYPLFYAHESRAFAKWLARRLVPGPGKPVADRIRKGAPLPSPKLLDRVVECIKGQKDWRLLDEQKTAYFAIRHAVQMAQAHGEKKVFIVRGGPGTGKSVLAIQLLADAARQHWKVVHATGSKAFQTVLQARTQAFSLEMMKKIHNAKTKKALPVDNLFATFANVAKLGANDPDRLDLVVCDEAHRLWKFRRIKYPSGTVKWLSDRSMIDEVIASSRVSVFFLDDNQSVRAGEIGHSSLIVERIKALGIKHEVHDLDAQFRCAGSTSYIHWVEGVLDFRQGLDHEWKEESVYRSRIWDDVEQMDAHLRRLCDEGRRCRLVAAYCWKWSKPDALGKLPHDLADDRFGEWSGAWIAKTGLNLRPLDHQYYKWATFDEAYEQVGSIYSVQGFEFDDIGVIWGEDLVWRENEWVAQIDQNKDNAFKKELRNSGADPVEKLRNVYRVLLTRGMQSTHLFILDDETRDHVRACLEAKSASLPLAVGEHVSRKSAPISLVAPTRQSFAPSTIERPDVEPWSEAVPMLDFACLGDDDLASWRSLIDVSENEDWVTWENAPAFHPGDFVAQVTDGSMSPVIENGEWCLFKPAPVAQAIGRPALVRVADTVTGESRFVVRTVRVGWAPNKHGEFVRNALTLECDDGSVEPECFDAEDQSRVTVLAIVRQVLGRRQ